MTRVDTILEVDQELIDMLSYRRPAGSKTERAFIAKYLTPLNLSQDAYGNLFTRFGDAPVLWSSHVDTVHRQGGRQLIDVSPVGFVRSDDTQSNCLGADCTAGVWLMIQMIRAKRPGLYIFHRAEEIGGLGSSHLACNRPDLFKGIKYAIAFDRRGTSSVITHQWGGRCCSDAFGNSLSAALGMQHKLDDTGSFTDTANYTELVGECTNLSVGYYSEHTKQEKLDFEYLSVLRDALLRLDVADLVYSREPGEADADFPSWLYDDAYQEPIYRSRTTIERLVRDHPDEIADYLESLGIDADELEQAIYERGGVVRKL